MNEHSNKADWKVTRDALAVTYTEAQRCLSLRRWRRFTVKEKMIDRETAEVYGIMAAIVAKLFLTLVLFVIMDRYAHSSSHST